MLMEKVNYSFGIMGRFDFSVQCANVLLGEGVDLKFVVTLNEQLLQWARSHQLNHFLSIEEFKESELAPVDFILCVGLLDNLPPWILEKANLGIICYHNNRIDGELSNFDPALAILAQKKTHAVSWYQLSQQNDKSDILFESVFPISPKDTASHIIRRCEADALTGLHQVIASLRTAEKIIPLRKSVKISYQKDLMILPNAGVLNWENTATELETLCRALDFDHYLNLYGTAKLVGNSGIYIVSNVAALPLRSQFIPGTVVKISSKAIRVACKQGRLEIKSLQDQYGKTIDIRTFVQNENLKVGGQLPLFSAEELEYWEEQQKYYRQTENGWAERESAKRLKEIFIV
jgi:methionyl-tRNA formyltransferase